MTNEQQIAMNEMILHDEIRRIERVYGDDANRKCNKYTLECSWKDKVAGDDAGIVAFRWGSGWTNRRVAGIGMKLDDVWQIVLVYKKLMIRNSVDCKMYELAYHIHTLKDLARLATVSETIDRLEKGIKGMVRD